MVVMPPGIRKACEALAKGGEGRRRLRRGALVVFLSAAAGLWLPSAQGGSDGPSGLVPLCAALALAAVSSLGRPAARRPVRLFLGRASPALAVTGTGRMTIVPVVRPRRGGAEPVLGVAADRVRVAPYLRDALARAGGPGVGAREGGSLWRPPAGVVGIALLAHGDVPGRAAPEPSRPPAARPVLAPSLETRMVDAAGGPGAEPFPPGAGGAAGPSPDPEEGPAPSAPPAGAGEPPLAPGLREAAASGSGDPPAGEPAAGGLLAAAPALQPGTAVTGFEGPEAAPPGVASRDGSAALRGAPGPTGPASPGAPARRRRPGLLARRRAVLGIDIGSHSVKVVEAVGGRRGGFAVLDAWDFRTPPGAVVEGALAGDGTVAVRLGQLVGELRLGSRRAVAGLGVQKALARVVTLPPMSRAEVARALQWEAENYVPLPLDQAVVDFVLGPPAPGAEGREEMEVLVVAAPRDAVTSLASVVRGSGLSPVAVDLEPLAAFRALEALGLAGPGEAAREGYTVLLDLGDAGTRVSVFSGGLPIANRVVRVGGQHFTEAIVQGLGVPVERAEAAKRRWGVREGTPVQPFVSGVLDNLLQDVWRSLEYFLVLSRTGRAGIERVFLVGGNALQPGLPEVLDRFLRERLQERFGQGPREGSLVRLVEPGPVPGAPGRRGEGETRLDARFTLALGLALWRD